MTMERKIGEIFEYNGEWHQTVKSQGKCCSCDFMIDGHCIVDFSSNGSCFYCHRKDKENVIFKKLEKDGEPMEFARGLYFQRYRAYSTAFYEGDTRLFFNAPTNTFVYIEIKQKQRDMEEKKLNLKPFSLEAAKQGKPVCTRDGRKARIICFDAKFPKTGNIVTLVEKENGEEVTLYHYDDGLCSIGRGYDLMMLPEKKEGWVNVYKGGLLDTKSYNTRKEAFDKACPKEYVDTVKISWEE